MAHEDWSGSLQIVQDLAGQRRGWRAQRIGWVLLAMFVVAALLGLFGPGPLSRAIAGQERDPLWAEYYRFWRFQAPMTLRIHVVPEATGGRELRIWLSRPYLQGMSVQHITPEPVRVEAGADRFTYVFALGEPAGATAVTFTLEPEARGTVRGRVGVEAGPTIGFRHFVYP